MTQALQQITGSLGTVELKIPAKAEWVAVARLAIAAVANRLNFSIEDIEDVKLAVAEACTHCIQQGGRNDAIWITCETEPEMLTIRVRDEQNRVRPTVVSDGGTDDQRLGSLGVFLIRSLMDSVDYDVDPERGTSLVMTKKVLN